MSTNISITQGVIYYSIFCSWIISQLPPSKQIMVFSATYPNELDSFLSQYMESPTMIKLDGGDVQLVGIKQYLTVIDTDSSFRNLASDKTERIFLAKLDRLEALLKRVNYSQAMIFCNFQEK